MPGKHKTKQPAHTKPTVTIETRGWMDAEDDYFNHQNGSQRSIMSDFYTEAAGSQPLILLA